MGFYAPAQIVRDAREHGIEVLPVDINKSGWDNLLEEEQVNGHFSVRLGFRQISGLKREEMTAFVERRVRHFTSPDEARRITGLPITTLERLASADAYRSMGLDRRQALWAVRGMVSDHQLPLFDAADTSALGPDIEVKLPQMPLREHVVADYQTHRLSLKAHPLELLRPLYDKGIRSEDPRHKHRQPRRTLTAEDLLKTHQNSWVTVAGVVLIRQRPGTAKGVVFITLEDETGTVNIVVWSKIMAKYRRIVMSGRLITVRGKVQREGEVIHVVAQELIDRTNDLDALSHEGFELAYANADHVEMDLPRVSPMERKVKRLEASGETARRDIAGIVDEQKTKDLIEAQKPVIPSPVKPIVVNQGRHPRNVRIIPKSRDFH